MDITKREKELIVKALVDLTRQVKSDSVLSEIEDIIIKIMRGDLYVHCK